MEPPKVHALDHDEEGDRSKRERLEDPKADRADDIDDEPEYIPVAKRKELQRIALMEKIQGAAPKEVEQPKQEFKPQTLLDQRALMLKQKEGKPDNELEEQVAEEKKIMEELTTHQRPLMAVAEIAKGIKYTDPLKTTWTAPRWVLELPPDVIQSVRDEFHIIIEGEAVPPPLWRFKDFKLPAPMMDVLRNKKIRRPTPIQCQGLSVALSGRDMIGVAFTGSGKTMVFVIPAVVQALEEERRLPITMSEGPFSLILCPSRELARQTYEVTKTFCEALRDAGYPWVRPLLCIGGIDMREQDDVLRRGAHIVVATPGRLIDMLTKHRFTLNYCKFVTLDEADRMIDFHFEEEIRNIFDFFKSQRQTLLFSATMPKKVQEFAKESLVCPIVVNVGRAGAANLDVIQEVEYVKQEAKMMYLLNCLQKTAPPVLIFCENKADVDDIHEYLLLKGVAAVAIHGSKDQSEREAAIQGFKQGTKDVLVATDVASKGLDFPDIQHVINYDMPKEIENYVHRIGRTGRCGKTGVATTFINKNTPESVLLDLKHLLIEAKQKVPPVLLSLPDPSLALLDNAAGKGCIYCGGLGHRVTNCPKLQAQSLKQAPRRQDQSMPGGDY